MRNLLQKTLLDPQLINSRIFEFLYFAGIVKDLDISKIIRSLESPDIIAKNPAKPTKAAPAKKGKGKSSDQTSTTSEESTARPTRKGRKVLDIPRTPEIRESESDSDILFAKFQSRGSGDSGMGKSDAPPKRKGRPPKSKPSPSKATKTKKTQPIEEEISAEADIDSEDVPEPKKSTEIVDTKKEIDSEEEIDESAEGMNSLDLSERTEDEEEQSTVNQGQESGTESDQATGTDEEQSIVVEKPNEPQKSSNKIEESTESEEEVSESEGEGDKSVANDSKSKQQANQSNQQTESSQESEIEEEESDTVEEPSPKPLAPKKAGPKSKTQIPEKKQPNPPTSKATKKPAEPKPEKAAPKDKKRISMQLQSRKTHSTYKDKILEVIKSEPKTKWTTKKLFPICISRFEIEDGKDLYLKKALKDLFSEATVINVKGENFENCFLAEKTKFFLLHFRQRHGWII